MAILLLAGSPSFPSRSTRLLQHIGEKLGTLGHCSSRLHVTDLPAQALLHAEFNNTDIKLARLRVAEASAVVIATPGMWKHPQGSSRPSSPRARCATLGWNPASRSSRW